MFSKKYQLQVKKVVEKDERTLLLRKTRQNSSMLSPVNESSSNKDQKRIKESLDIEEGKNASV